MPFPENALERALAAGRAGEASEDDVVDALAGASVWVPASVQTCDEAPFALPGLTLDGGQFVQAYSSESELRLATDGSPSVVVPAAQLARILPGHVGIVLNWNGTVGMAVEPAGVARLLGTAAPAAPGPGQVRLEEPDPRPDVFLRALSRLFADEPRVRTARCGLMRVGDAVPVLLVGVEAPDADPDTERRIVLAVAAAAAPARVEYPVEVFFVSANPDEVGAYLVAEVEPFYTRRPGAGKA